MKEVPIEWTKDAPCPHNWIPCEWVESKRIDRDSRPVTIRKVTKLYCTLCDTKKDVQ